MGPTLLNYVPDLESDIERTSELVSDHSCEHKALPVGTGNGL